MRVGISAVSILWMILAGTANEASAASIVEQRFSNFSSSFPATEFSTGSSATVFAPFELPSGGGRLEQIVWWGGSLPPWASSRSGFTIRFHDSIAQGNGEFLPDRSATVEFTVSAESETLGPFTDLFWVNLPEPIFLPMGVQYLSIVGPDFYWHMADEDETNLRTRTLRQVGNLEIFVLSDESDAAFVLNDTAAPIPEPSTAVLTALGLTALAARRKV